MIDWGNFSRACELSLGCISGRVSINFQPLLAALEVWDKDGLELCLSLGLEPAPESGLLLGAWISCAPPGHRGDTEQEPEKKLKCAGGT